MDTVTKAHQAGLSACSGLIAGMGESDEDLVDVVFALRELDPDSVPVNFLIPFEGTPLAKEWNLTPQRCLRILAMVRFVCPDVEVRIAGGREVHLRTMQPLALHLANSIFLGDYLTSEGQAGRADLEMIADAGFEVEGTDQVTLPEHRKGGVCGSGETGGCGSHEGGTGCAPAETSGGCGPTRPAVAAGRTRTAVRKRTAVSVTRHRLPHGPDSRVRTSSPYAAGAPERTSRPMPDPKLSVDDLLALDRRHVWHPYGPMPGRQDPLVVESASGCGCGWPAAGASWWTGCRPGGRRSTDTTTRCSTRRRADSWNG